MLRMPLKMAMVQGGGVSFMVLKLDDKKTIVNEVADVAKRAVSLIAAEYSGLTVAQLTDLRKSARTSAGCS
jgi:ribosomal protein L10